MASENDSVLANDYPLRVSFQYTIASGDMRFIERTERYVVIIGAWSSDWVIRGEVIGCGNACHANLSQILLEYLMSCEGCEGDAEFENALHQFCERLAGAVYSLYPGPDDLPDAADPVELAIGGICRSMATPFSLSRMGETRLVEFPDCPICGVAEKSGIHRGLAKAHEFFLLLSRNMIETFGKEIVLESQGAWNEPGHRLGFRFRLR